MLGNRLIKFVSCSDAASEQVKVISRESPVSRLLYFHAPPRFNEFPFADFSSSKRGLVYSPLSCCARFSSNPGQSTFETSFLRWERYWLRVRGRLTIGYIGKRFEFITQGGFGGIEIKKKLWRRMKK